MTGRVVDVLPAVLISFTLGTFAYSILTWLRGRIERIWPAKWRYRDVCGRGCGIR